MRLAVFTNQFPSRVSTFFARDIRSLLEAGIEVDIFPIYPLDEKLWAYVPDILNETVLPRDKVHHISIRENLFFQMQLPFRKPGLLLRDGLSISTSAIKYGLSPLAKSLYVLPIALKLAQQYKDVFDHVMAYWGNYAGTCAYVFHRLLNRQIPFSILLHAGTDLYRTQVFLRQKLCYADNVFVVCDFNRRFIKDLYPDIFERIANKIQLHHLGLDLARLPYKPDQRLSNRVLAVGNLAKLKGFDYLLRASHELGRRGKEIEVELIGGGKQEQSLRALAKELRIEDRVIFRGWIPFDKVCAAMSNATILVHPSTGLGDAVPTVIKEAMALGTPIIASNVAGIPELLNGGKCGVLVPPKDVNAIVNAIEILIDDRTHRQRLIKAARQYGEANFDLWRNGKRLAEILCSTRRTNNSLNCKLRSSVV